MERTGFFPEDNNNINNSNNDNNHHTLQSSTSPSGKMIPASAWKVVAILISIATMVMYAETMLVPAIPDLIKDFNITI